jgi:hypothetical protein
MEFGSREFGTAQFAGGAGLVTFPAAAFAGSSSFSASVTRIYYLGATFAGTGTFSPGPLIHLKYLTVAPFAGQGTLFTECLLFRDLITFKGTSSFTAVLQEVPAALRATFAGSGTLYAAFVGIRNMPGEAFLGTSSFTPNLIKLALPAANPALRVGQGRRVGS